MHASVVTLFPELFEPFLSATVFGRAVQKGLLRIDLTEMRTFGEGRPRMVDDRPFGGGPGMVLRAEPVVQAVRSAQEGHGPEVRVVFLSQRCERVSLPVGQVDHDTVSPQLFLWQRGPTHARFRTPTFP